MAILRTERTVIDYITLDDAPFFVSLVNTPDWIRFIGDRNVANVDDARRYLQGGFLKSYRDNKFGYYLVSSTDGEPIGIAGFLRKVELENPDFGFALMPEHYGQGLALEASTAVLTYGIKMFDFSVLDAVVLADNMRSIRLLEKLDFLHHGSLPAAADQALLLYRWHSPH